MCTQIHAYAYSSYRICIMYIQTHSETALVGAREVYSRHFKVCMHIYNVCPIACKEIKSLSQYIIKILIL